MNARQAANVEHWATEDEARKAVKAEPCLCGRPVFVYVPVQEDVPADVWDLCATCSAAFQDLADAIAERTELDATVGALELGAVLSAFRTGEWDGVGTATIDHVLQHDGAGFRRDELAVLRAILRRRA